MKKDMGKVYKICLTGVMAAVIAVCTFVLRLPIASGQGYIHLGDSMVYLSGCILGFYGVAASAIGGALADILSGFPVWAVPTAIIKALCCVPFVIAVRLYKKKNSYKTVSVYTLIAAVISGVITVLGYMLFELFMYSKEAALMDAVWNIVQATASAVIFVVVGTVIDKIVKKPL